MYPDHPAYCVGVNGGMTPAAISFLAAQIFPYHPDTQTGPKEKDIPKTEVTKDMDH